MFQTEVCSARANPSQGELLFSSAYAPRCQILTFAVFSLYWSITVAIVMHTLRRILRRLFP